MKPSIGRIVQYNLPGMGWRPMIITGVHGPHEATDGSMNPQFISGWVKLDPDDLVWRVGGVGYEIDGDQHVGTEHPLTRCYEHGLAIGDGHTVKHGWRWPLRV